MQLTFDFNDFVTLTDKDGDTIITERYTDNVKAVRTFLGCAKSMAEEILAQLKKDYEIYCPNECQIILCQGGHIIYNFEMYGMTYYNGHKYNSLNDWSFKKFLEGEKPKEKKPPKIKKIMVTCTEKQIKRAHQLYYAMTLGFDITHKDYERFYLL
jgi:hypothetical protein